MSLARAHKTVGLFVVVNLLGGLWATSNVRAQTCSEEDKTKAQSLIKQGTR